MEQEPQVKHPSIDNDQMRRFNRVLKVYFPVAMVITVMLIVAFIVSVHQMVDHVAPPFLIVRGTPKQRLGAITEAWVKIVDVIPLLIVIVGVVFALLAARTRTDISRGLVARVLTFYAFAGIISAVASFSVYLAALFGWINTVGNALVAIFTLVYVLATIVIVVQNERARQTQLQIAREQSTAQKEQDHTRDETAQQTSEALALLAANLATLTAILEKQQDTARQVEPPVPSPNGRCHTSESRLVDDVMGVDS